MQLDLALFNSDFNLTMAPLQPIIWQGEYVVQ